MTVFWITAGALLVASAIAMMIALRRGVPDADTAGAADLRVYRDQLAEIERDAARGTIPTEEAARLRVEVSDGNPEVPVIPDDAEPFAVRGRGLLLLRDLSDAYGFEPLAAGKVIWFELRRPPG